MTYAHCLTVRDPWHPHTSREIRPLTGAAPLRALAPKTDKPFIILRNGQAVLRADWDQPVERGDLVAVVMLPQGGGGGGGSNPLRMVAMLAVTMFAPQIAWGIEGALGANGIAVGASGLGMIQAGVGLVGAALVNAVIPPPKPPSPHQAASLAAPSPTYNLQAQGNMARLDQAIPVQYGRLDAFPDFAAQPYTEYAGNEQYLYQLLCLGQGEYSIEAIRIEDTPIASFSEITYEVVPPGGAISLFPANVSTSGEVSGQEIQYNVYLGGYVANSAGTQATALGVDFVLPRGLYEVNATTGVLMDLSLSVVVEARAIDNNGAAIGVWTQIGARTYTAKTTTPQRYSERYSVTAGRYEVRVKRTDMKQTDTRFGHEILWGGLRAYLPETRAFGEVTLIALRMRASNNLSAQASRKINVICTRKLPIWNGSTWSAPTATSSIAWAFADVCRNTTYGAKLADSRIDLAALLTLDAIWSARGDEFNGRFDSALSFWEAMSKIAVAGRAKPYMQGGIVRIARDGPQTVPVALFSMRNIVKGSFSIDYIMPSDDTADAVEVAYFDRNYWASRRVVAALPDSVSAKKAKIDLFGVTEREHAYREGMYQAASNRYRRRMVKFSTEMEGFIPAFGDLIAIQHDMPGWGQHAEVTDWDEATRTLTLSEPLTWGSGTHYVSLRTKAGGVDGPYVVTAGAADNQLVLGSSPAVTPYAGSAYERTHAVFGWAETWRQTAKVISVRPRGLYQVEIEAITEDPSVHTAENGLIAPAVQTSQLTTRYTTPLIADLTLRSSTSDNSKALLTWTPAPGAETYQVEMAAGTSPYDANLAWTRVGETSANNYAVTALYGAQTLIRVRGVGLSAGPWVTLFYGASADYMWVLDSALMWNATDTTLMWRY